MKSTRVTYREIQRRLRALQTDPEAVRAAVFVRPTETEAAARHALEARRNKPFTANEWDDARANLLAFAGVLAEWSERDESAKA